MYLVRIQVLAILLLFLNTAWAETENASNNNNNPIGSMLGFPSDCICQIGERPGYQVPFFRAGCKLWFLQNNCKSKIIQSIRRPMQVPDNAIYLKVGYVGHWSSSNQLIKYLKNSISPLLKSKNSLQAILIDNTACSAMENPNGVHRWLQTNKELFPGKIFIRGNQANSIGLWQPFFWGKANFTASVDMDGSSPVFPECYEYLNQRCVDFIQGRQTGICQDSNNKLRELRCEVVTSYVQYLGEDGQLVSDPIQDSLWQITK